ncbi:phosphorylase family protein [Halovenus sp. HT40]|uniref:phosphorylase family protein n=1 Tax=Halovenus sp. HT40 TaxID=3126691 RepID=UPI00300E9DF0
MTVDLAVLVFPAFDELAGLPGEAAPWTDAYEFAAEADLPGLATPLRYTDEGLGIVPTGVGKSSAATTATALLANDRIDLTDAVILSVGVAGAPPTVPVGSVVVSDQIVDWDDKCRFGGELAMNPYTESQGQYDLDSDLVERIESLGKSVDLDSPVDGAPEPRLLTGTNLCGDELWHGAEVAEQAEWLVDQYDASPYRVTEMEDAGTAAALERFARLDSYCAIRGVSNHDRPTGTQSARESFFDDEFEDGFGVAVENAVAVARTVVDNHLE